MENLRQIEEKQRRKEAEKAQRLLEEKLDEERIARERAELKAIAEAESKERFRRKVSLFSQISWRITLLIGSHKR